MVVFSKVLTAAHCICQFYDDDDPNDRVNKYCTPNPKPPTKPANQQTNKDAPLLNHIVIMVGDKDYEKATTTDVQEAYVMQTDTENQNVVLKNSFDIGIIKPSACYPIAQTSNGKFLQVPLK